MSLRRSQLSAFGALLVFAQLGCAQVLPHPEVQEAWIETVEDAKSVEDLARVRRHAFEAELRFIDMQDGKPIKGVPISVFGKRVVSDENGITRVSRPADIGFIAGLDTSVAIAEVAVARMSLSKDGKEVDTSRLVLPHRIRITSAQLSTKEILHIDVPLNFEGIITSGRFDVDDSALGTAEQTRTSMRENAGVLVDSEHRGGEAYQLPGANVSIGPLSYVPDRGYVLLGSSAFPVQLGEGFDVRVKCEPSVQRVDVEWTDPKWFVVRAARIDQAGVSLMRVTDGFVKRRGQEGIVNLTAPVGKFVVLPGQFVLNLDQKTVAEAILAGIDVADFGLQTVEIASTGKPIEELPAISLRGSIFDARASIERIRQELAKRKAASEPLKSDAPVATPETK